jgi:hypothetical protein
MLRHVVVPNENPCHSEGASAPEATDNLGKFCHSDRSRTLSEAEGDGGVEEPASRVRHLDPEVSQRCLHNRGRAALQRRVKPLMNAGFSPRGRNRWKPSATRHSRFRTLLSHLLLSRHLPLRLRPLPFLIPPIMKRLVRRLFLHPSSLTHQPKHIQRRLLTLLYHSPDIARR